MKPISFNIKPSRYLSVVLTLITVLAILSILLSPLSLFIQYSLLLLLMVAYVYAMAKHALLRLPNSILHVHITAKGQCFVQTKAHIAQALVPQEITILADSVVHPWLTTLVFQHSRWMHQAIILMPDHLDAEAFRALRVWLLWSKQEKENAELNGF